MKHPEQPYLSIVIPAYNEAKRIPDTLQTIHSYCSKKISSYEIIVVDDGSSDNTTKTVEALQIPYVRVLHRDSNVGKGMSVHEGMLHARGQYILMCDADNATPIEELDKFMPHLADHPVLIGTRYFPKGSVYREQTRLRLLAARLGNMLTQVLILPGIPDTQCGFKVFEHSAAKRIFSNQTIWGWGFDMEILLIAKRLGYKIKQIPVVWYNKEGSKVESATAFLTALVELLRIKWMNYFRKYE